MLTSTRTVTLQDDAVGGPVEIRQHVQQDKYRSVSDFGWNLMQDDELDQPLQTVVSLVRKVAEWSSKGDEEKQKRAQEGPSEEDRKKAREQLKKYNPMVPGKVVYTFRYDCQGNLWPNGSETTLLSLQKCAIGWPK